MRTAVDLRPDQIAALDRRAAQLRISRAEAIRRAIDSWLEDDALDEGEDERLFKEAFGMWKDRHMDAVEYVRQQWSEWPRGRNDDAKLES